MNCFVMFIYKYRNSFLEFLPLVNQCVSKNKIYHNEYATCIELLLNYGNFDEIDNMLEDHNFDFLLSVDRPV